jgi:hypothetical protein
LQTIKCLYNNKKRKKSNSLFALNSNNRRTSVGRTAATALYIVENFSRKADCVLYNYSARSADKKQQRRSYRVCTCTIFNAMLANVKLNRSKKSLDTWRRRGAKAHLQIYTQHSLKGGAENRQMYPRVYMVWYGSSAVIRLFLYLRMWSSEKWRERGEEINSLARERDKTDQLFAAPKEF